MDVIHTHVAGVDVHKDILVITTLIGDPGGKVESQRFECKTFTDDLEEMGKTLIEMGVRNVAMESTGVYWKPVANVWQQLGIKVCIGNAQHIRNVPGRKTDVKDSQWIAQLHRNGLIQASFIPEQEFQQLRDLTRQRDNTVSDINRVKNRVGKVLQSGNVKLSSVASDIFGTGGMSVLRLIAQGTTDPDILIAAIKTSLKKKKGDLRKSLTNKLTENHCFLVKQLLGQYDQLKSMLNELTTEIERRLEPHDDLVERLAEIPGIGIQSAQAIVAEATASMDSFRDDRAFAAWAGTAPGNRESAGKKKESEHDKGTQR